MFPLDDPAHRPAPSAARLDRRTLFDSPVLLDSPVLFDPVLLGVLTAAVEEESAAAYEAGFSDGLREARFREARAAGSPATATAGHREAGPPGADASKGPPPGEQLWTVPWPGDGRPAQ